MENREIGDGETVKRENCTAGLLFVGLGGRHVVALMSGGDSIEEVGSGSKEKSSSHSNPVPAHNGIRKIYIAKTILNLFIETSIFKSDYLLSSEIFPSEESSVELAFSC